MIPRPVIIGMNNPVSSDPAHALYPLPRHHAGGRLWQMLHEQSGATMRQYVDGFDRRNLVIGPWDRSIARIRAHGMLPGLCGRDVVLLGQQVWEAFQMPPEVIYCNRFELALAGVTFYRVPHPSGRNLWYNDETNRRAVGRLLADLYRGEKE